MLEQEYIKFTYCINKIIHFLIPTIKQVQMNNKKGTHNGFQKDFLQFSFEIKTCNKI